MFVRVVKKSDISAAANKAVPERGPKACPWRAVSITGGTYACKAARGVSCVRYLCGKAPSLPLPDCDKGACTCHYKHHEDRRDGNRRTTAFLSTIETWRTEERRSTRGRRLKDRP